MISHVPPQEMRFVWHIVRPWLESAAEYSCGEWIPEDVYHEVRSGTATLLMAETEEGSPVGCAVIRDFQGHAGRVMYLWIIGGDPGLISDYWADLERIARSMKADKIMFMSPRRGWEKLGAPMGFRQTHTCYVKEL